MIDRWSCESYCRCETRKGHFEKSDQGVWVLYDDHAKLLSARLQQLDDLRWLIANGEQHFGTLWREATEQDIAAARGFAEPQPGDPT